MNIHVLSYMTCISKHKKVVTPDGCSMKSQKSTLTASIKY